MLKTFLFIYLAALCPTPQNKDIKLNETNISEVINAMTIEEKCELIVGGRAEMFKPKAYRKIKAPGAAGVINEIPRLGVPAVVLADGPAGVRIRPHRPGDDRTFYCTGFPIGSLISSTWNTELVEETGKAMGKEAKEYGVDVLLTPGINIHRNPLCGRNFEYYSEDPLLSGKIAAAMINGIESNDVGTSVKHYAANNQETNRLANNSIVSERALREIYLKAFEIAVKEAQPWTIMSSYNYINGEHASQSHRLLTEILRDEWGFEGVVVSDWGAGYDEAAQIRSGNDLIQPGYDYNYHNLLNAVKDGRLSVEDIDRSVERILKLSLKTNRYKRYKYSEAPDLAETAVSSRKIAEEGIILLKNKKETLPVSTSDKVALFGVTSYDFIAGGTGSGDVHRPYVVDLMQGLGNAGFTLDPDVTGFYSSYMADEKMRCDRINGDNGWQIDRERAIEVTPVELIRKAAENSDCAIITFGRVFGEGKDRNYHYNYLLSKDEIQLIERVSKEFHKHNKKVSVILNIGGLVDVQAWRDMADAILLCWLPGQEGGNAVASVLSGTVNPSGHLPSTISKDYWQEPSAGNFPILYADKPFNYSFYRQLDGSVRDLIKDIDYTVYEEGIYVGYRYFNTFKKKAIAYPFGHGLSYTDFKYSKMTVKETANGWKVNVTVTNTGDVAGKDVVQVYVKAPRKGLDKPERELKGFTKTPLLAPGESYKADIFITDESLASYDEESKSWITETGYYTFVAAKNSLDNSRRKRVFINPDKKLPVQDRTEIFISRSDTAVHYRIPAIAALPDGTITAVADYRFSRNDIGIVKDGRVDLRARTSSDNGCTWDEIVTAVEGKGKDSPDFMNVGFGDPAIVADRKSGKMLLMCAAGNVSFLDGTRDCHLRICRMYSDDKGKTWTKPEDISEDIYSIFDNSTTGPAKSMFVTSGRIVQSKYVKVGKYYRLYCAVLQVKGDDSWVNFVLYSDDFGKSWNVLGDIETAGIPHDANEAKVEELPGGDVLLSSRTDLEGRLFNIFKFEDIRKATGSWGTMAHSCGHNNGIVTEKNSCNGELLVVPARRSQDGKKIDLLLQSAPIGPKRANVGIYYKALELDREYTPEEIASDWEGVFRVTDIGSAYSVMAGLADGKIGFAYEEKTYYPTSGAGYTIVYDAFSVEEITGGAYTTTKK